MHKTTMQKFLKEAFPLKFLKLFVDKKFYNSVMEEIAKASYKYLRSGNGKCDKNILKSNTNVAEKSPEYKED